MIISFKIEFVQTLTYFPMVFTILGGCKMYLKIVMKRNLVSIGIALPLQEGMFDWCVI